MSDESKLCPLCVMFTAKDMQTSVKFYRDVLGFKLEQSWPNEDDPKWANMVLDRQSVMLGEAGTKDGLDKFDLAEKAKKMHLNLIDEFAGNAPGAGVMIYLNVEDVDQYYAGIQERGAKPDTEPVDQFYGIRDFHVQDPSGYRLVFYQTIAMTSCQSCGMPLSNAKPGEMYCQYCTDDKGNLKPYEEVLEGTIVGYFMGMQSMSREQAEPAAKAHLANMPAWQCQ